MRRAWTYPSYFDFFFQNVTSKFCSLFSSLTGNVDVLVIPIRFANRFSNLNAVEVADLSQIVQKVQKVMENVHDTQSSTIIIQDGPDAGQTVQVRY